MSVPYCVSEPTLEQQGDTLIAHNGSWRCDSGSVDQYVFAFQRDGGPIVQGTTPPPFTDISLGFPVGASVSPCKVTDFDIGHTYRVYVYGGFRSVYIGFWDGWEWGRYTVDKTDAVSSNLVVSAFTVVVPPLQQAINLLEASTCCSTSYKTKNIPLTRVDKALAILKGL